jgi:hypothetical protein
MRILKIVGLILVGIAVAALVGFLLGIAVMALWNWLMPELFGLPEIGYWQAVGLFVLCHLLFKGHGFGHHDDRNDEDRRSDHPFARRIHGLIRGNGKGGADDAESEGTAEGIEP